jgi:hypothetical protein
MSATKKVVEVNVNIALTMSLFGCGSEPDSQAIVSEAVDMFFYTLLLSNKAADVMLGAWIRFRFQKANASFLFEIGSE